MSVGRFVSPAHEREFAAAYQAAMEEMPAADSTDDVATAFGTVRAYRFGTGSGTPLVLLSGSCAPLWAPNLPGPADGNRPVVALDLLGTSGMSVQQQPLKKPDDQADWLAQTLDGLGIASAHVAGMSFGGWSAVQLAARHPGRVASLILLDPVQTFGRLGPGMLLYALGMASPFPRMQERSLRRLSGGADPAHTAGGQLVLTGVRCFRSQLPPLAYVTDEQLSAVSAPALVLLGGRSIVHDVRKAEGRARLLPDSRVEVWPDASHVLNAEFPDRVAERTAAFLDGR